MSCGGESGSMALLYYRSFSVIALRLSEAELSRFRTLAMRFRRCLAGIGLAEIGLVFERRTGRLFSGILLFKTPIATGFFGERRLALSRGLIDRRRGRRRRFPGTADAQLLTGDPNRFQMVDQIRWHIVRQIQCAVIVVNLDA